MSRISFITPSSPAPAHMGEIYKGGELYKVQSGESILHVSKIGKRLSAVPEIKFEETTSPLPGINLSPEATHPPVRRSRLGKWWANLWARPLRNWKEMSDKKKLKVMLLLGLPVLGFIAWFIGYMAYKGHMFWEEAEFQRVQEEQKIKESTMFPESILKSDQQEVRNKNKWSKGYMYNRRALPINYPVMIMSSPTTSPTEITSLSTVSSVKVPVMRISVPFTS